MFGKIIEMIVFKRGLPSGKRILASGIFIFGLIVTLFLLNFFYPTSARIAWNKDDYQKSLDKLVEKESHFISDSLPYYQYKRQQDSIRSQLFDESDFGGNSTKTFDMGIKKIDSDKSTEQYYLIIGGYYAKDYFEFYSLHRRNYVEYSIFKEAEGSVRYGEMKKNEIKVKLEQVNDREWQINYPISKATYTIWQAIIVTLSFIFIGLLFMTIVGWPLHLLFLIAKGKAFSNKAILILYTIAYVLLFAGVFRAIVRLALHLYYKARVPYPVTFYYYDDIMSGWDFIMAGLIVLLFAKAFHRGYELQKEQELTI
jgi:hypothetical protein